MTTEPFEFDERLSEGEHPASTADELVVHGLIESRARDTEASQSRRVASAMDAIRTPSPLRLADRFRGIRIFAAAASLLLVLGLMSMLFTSTAQTADALVNSSIARAVDAGPRRYSLMVAAEQNTEPVEVGTLDLAPPGRMLLKTKTPENDELVVGRNETGEWAVRRDGAVDRAEPRRSWPGWLHLADDALIASPEEVLEVLARDYDLRIEAGDRIGGRPQRMVVGTAKSGGPSRRPSEVQVFLDERTLTVTRMELRWSADAIQGARDRINRAASVSEDPSSDGSNDGPRGRPDRPPGERDGPGPDGREPRPRPRMPHGPLGGPMGGPRGGPPMGDGEPHPEGPNGADGDRGDRRPPRGSRPLPPAVLRFEAVPVESFTADWFDPSAHQPK